MKTLTAWAAILLLSTAPTFAEEVTNCDGLGETDVIEALSQEQYPVTYIPDEYVGNATTVIENHTGSRYGKVDAVVVVEMEDHDVAVVFDRGGCITQVDLPPDLF
jgi:hypothetical protein